MPVLIFVSFFFSLGWLLFLSHCDLPLRAFAFSCRSALPRLLCPHPSPSLSLLALCVFCFSSSCVFSVLLPLSACGRLLRVVLFCFAFPCDLRRCLLCARCRARGRVCVCFVSLRACVSVRISLISALSDSPSHLRCVLYTPSGGRGACQHAVPLPSLPPSPSSCLLLFAASVGLVIDFSLFALL